jgi:hypothetical protein
MDETLKAKVKRMAEEYAKNGWEYSSGTDIDDIECSKEDFIAGFRAAIPIITEMARKEAPIQLEPNKCWYQRYVYETPADILKELE